MNIQSNWTEEEWNNYYSFLAEQEELKEYAKELLAFETEEYMDY